MFKKLRQKWKVSGGRLALILLTFAIGGSLTGFIAKKIMNALSIDRDWLWTIIYILLVTIIWPLAVLAVSVFFGQFKFFLNYVRRLGEKLGLSAGERKAQGSRNKVQEATAIKDRNI